MNQRGIERVTAKFSGRRIIKKMQKQVKGRKNDFFMGKTSMEPLIPRLLDKRIYLAHCPQHPPVQNGRCCDHNNDNDGDGGTKEEIYIKAVPFAFIIPEKTPNVSAIKSFYVNVKT